MTLTIIVNRKYAKKLLWFYQNKATFSESAQRLKLLFFKAEMIHTHCDQDTW